MGAVVPPPAVRTAAALLFSTALLFSAALLAGCGPPPQVAPTPDGPLPGPDTPGSPGADQPGPSGTPPPVTPTPAPDEAVGCDGRPDAEQVLTVLRAAGMLDDDADATVVEGPLCAADWQYAVVRVPDLDPLHVVTSGEPDDLELVTAGTDVCTVEVRVHAPRGIRAVASCVG